MPHWHHRHDAQPCADDHGWPDWLLAIFATLDRMESHMSAQQTSIDTAVAVIGDLVAEVQNLKAQNPGVDTSALDAAVSAAQEVINPAVPDAPAPVEAAPAEAAPEPAPVDAAPVDAPAPVDQAQTVPADVAPAAPAVPLA